MPVNSIKEYFSYFFYILEKKLQLVILELFFVFVFFNAIYRFTIPSPSYNWSAFLLQETYSCCGDPELCFSCFFKCKQSTRGKVVFPPGVKVKSWMSLCINKQLFSKEPPGSRLTVRVCKRLKCEGVTLKGSFILQFQTYRPGVPRVVTVCLFLIPSLCYQKVLNVL